MSQPHDVLVVLSHERKYPLHANALARNSVFFANILTEPNAAKLSNKAKSAGIKIRWQVELVEMESEKYPAGRLELVKLNAKGERANGFSGLVINENGRVPTKLFDYWERVLYSFYRTNIRIADTDMIVALNECHGLIQVAEYLGCIGLIGKHVEVALIKHGQILFRSIQDRPYAWANMSFRLQSEIIFREAIMHLAGNWNKWSNDRTCLQSLRSTPAAKALAVKYHTQILIMSKRLENRLISHYPGDMAKPEEDAPIRREDYAKQVLVWMALSWFRQWLGQRLISGRGHHGPDGGYSLYKDIAAGGEAYMDKGVIDQFHDMFPMTMKALTLLEKHLVEIKKCMAEWVEKSHLMESKCQLNVQQYPVKYITFVEFEDTDFPWINKEQNGAKTLKRGKLPGGNDIVQRNLEAAKKHQEQSNKEFGSDDTDDEGEYKYEHEKPKKDKNASAYARGAKRIRSK